jgi:hypothetical protein
MSDIYDHASQDFLKSIKEEQISSDGMRIDREAFGKQMREELSKDEVLQGLYKSGDQEGAEDYFKREIYDKPKMFITRELIKNKFKIDRRPSFREILEYIFGDRETFDDKRTITTKAWQDFESTHTDMINENNYSYAHHIFTAYTDDDRIRVAIDGKKYADLDNLGLDMREWQGLGADLQKRIPSYVSDFVIDRVR